MKKLIASLGAIVMICPLFAQEQTAEPLPGQEPQGAIEKPISLIPETAPSITKPPLSSEPATSAEQKLAASKTIQSEADLKQRIRLRELKTTALKDPGLQEWRSRAELARTDPEKRDALREYYNRLYARILKLDGSLKDLVEKRRTASLARLSQSKIDPANINDEQESADRADEAQQ